MALAPRRPCTHPRCPQLLEAGESCPDHPRATARERGYSSRWDTYARDWLLRYPWCGMRQDGQLHAEHSACARRGDKVPARVVDHIRSMVSGGDVFDPANHQSLCVACNTKKG